MTAGVYLCAGFSPMIRPSGFACSSRVFDPATRMSGTRGPGIFAVVIGAVRVLLVVDLATARSTYCNELSGCPCVMGVATVDVMFTLDAGCVAHVASTVADVLATQLQGHPRCAVFVFVSTGVCAFAKGGPLVGRALVS